VEEFKEKVFIGRLSKLRVTK